MPTSSPRARVKAMPIAKTLPLDVGVIHFVGIGGIGMSGIAEILHNLGYQVQGSDVAANANTQRLADMGITIFKGHEAQHVLAAKVVVVSTAVKADNPEVIIAREQRIPVVRRAEMLAELTRMKLTVAVAGTHGKTTTTALVANMLESGGLEPTVINGGILNARSTNAYVGKGDWMVVEADESDGTFTRIPATVGVITNIDPEHLDHYGDFDTLKDAFHTFVTNLPFYGAAVMCIDHPEVQALVSRITDRRVITYGLSPQADIRALDVVQEAKGQRFNVVIADKSDHSTRRLENVFLAMHGAHNLGNALAAIGVAVELGISDDSIQTSLAGFQGVKRRFTYTGEAHGVSVVDDYAHHPVEIAATLAAARHVQDTLKGNVIAVAQPHRYTRLRDLFDDFCRCFNDADTVIITDIYAAGEQPIDGASQEALVSGIKRAGHKHVLMLESEDALPGLIKHVSQPGDMVVCMGAGSISGWANALPKKLETL